MSAKEIEIAIRQLPASELNKLITWLDEYRQQVWEKQIENDLEAGRLGALLAEVKRECQAGLAKPL